MTQEDKELLLKDLCARLPYGVKVRIYNPYRGGEYEYESITINNFNEIINTFGISCIEILLFPMTSMTDKQQNEFDRTYANDMQVVSDNLKNRLDGQSYEMNLGHYRHIDWLNVNHFDYRGLIEKGLALDATGLNIY